MRRSVRTGTRGARVAPLLIFLTAVLLACGGKETPSHPLSEIVVPSAYDAARPTPLVVFLHSYGLGSTNIVADNESWLQLRAAAGARSVLLSLPVGSTDTQGILFWNGAGCCDFYGSNANHVRFLEEVVADAKSRYNVDPKRVFLLGHSNGGFMAHRMACEASGTVAAIATIAGDVWKDPALCGPGGPVAVLQVHGDADAIVPYGGGPLSLPGTNCDFPSAPASAATWAARNGCTGALVDTATRLDLDTSIAGAETKVERHECTTGGAELWTMQGSGHAPAFAEPASTERLIDWLLSHPKP